MDTPRSDKSGMSAANGTPPPSVRRSPHKSNGDATLSPALSLEVKKLRSELRAKATEANDLAVEVRTLQSMIAAKDAAIEAAEGRRAALEEQALQLQGEAAEMRRAATKWELERKRLRAEAAAANAEADRLNQLMLSSAGDNSRVMNGSMEDVVRLHNQLAEARKEIKRLKDDVKGANNVIAAKDAAIDQMQGEIGAAREANAARRDDQNIILDLRRQLAEAHEQLGGEKRLGHIVETEIEDLKAALAAKNEELANSVGYMKSVQEELTAAQMAVAAAERAAALAKVEAANAMALAEKSKVAEAERMGGGGYVSKATHEAQVEALRQEADALRQQVAGSAEEVQIAKVLRERLLNAVDDAVLGAVGAEDVAERFGTATGAVEELRTELKELRSVLATKDAEAAALRAAREAAAARAAHERLAAHKLKTKLAEIMGEHSYSLEFHEPPPGPDTLAVAEAEALAAEELAAAASVTGVAAERDAALLQAADAKASVAGAHEAAEKAIAAAVAAASDARNEAEASAAAKVAAVEVSMATAHQEIEQLRGKMAEMEGVAAQLKAEAASKAEEAGASALELQAVREELAAAVAAKEEALAAATAGTATRDVHLIELQQQLAAAEEAAAATTAELATAKESAAAAIASAAAEAAAAHEMLAASQAEVEAVKAQLAEKLASAASLQAQVDELVTAQQTLQAEAASALEARDAAANEAAEQVAEAKRAAQSEAEKAATLEEMLSQTLEQLKLAEAGQAAAGVAANGGGEEVSSPEGAGGETDGLPTTPSKPKGDLLHELVASRVEVAELKQQNDELLSQVAALSPDRVPAAGGGTPLRGTPAVAEAALLAEADEYSEEDDDDDMVVMNIDSNGQPRTPLFQGAGAEGTEGVSPEALGLIVDKIIAARQAGGEAGSGGDTALYEQAVAMLQAELVKLGKEMVGKEDHVARLRAEVGSLQTAQMSAEQTAAVLEDYNRMSMKVAALQQQLVQRENEYFRCEASLLQDISVLNAKAKRRKGKGALKSLSKAAKVAMTSTTNAVTSTIRELQKPFDGAAEGQQPKSVSPYGKLLGLGKRWNSNQNLPRTSPERPLGAGMRS